MSLHFMDKIEIPSKQSKDDIKSLIDFMINKGYRDNKFIYSEVRDRAITYLDLSPNYVKSLIRKKLKIRKDLDTVYIND